MTAPAIKVSPGATRWSGACTASCSGPSLPAGARRGCLRASNSACTRQIRSARTVLELRLHVRGAVFRAGPLKLQRRRRVQPRRPAHRGRHQPAGCTRHPGAERTRGGAQCAAVDSPRQRPRVLRSRASPVGSAQGHRPAAAHPTWQAHVDRLCRAIQQVLALRDPRLLRLRVTVDSA